MKKKKVLMIVYTIYPFDARVRREAETLAESGSFEVTVLCLKEHSTPAAYTKEKVIVRELNQSKYFGDRRLRYVFSHLLFLIKAFTVCSRISVRDRVDILHVHNMPNFLVFAAIVPKLLGKTVILDMHDSVPDTFAAKFKGKHGLLFRVLCLEERLSAWMSDRVICVNHVQKQVTAARGIPLEKIAIFMNVPDHRRFRTPWMQKRSGNRKDGRFKVVYHGTITGRLGIDLAIEAVRRLRGQIPGLEFHVWGRGDYRVMIVGDRKGAAEEDGVFFHGMVAVERLPHALADMDVGLVPNRKSPATELMLPVKMMEYVALGIPVVAPRLKAIEHYFSDEMVSFFEPEDTGSMAEAILRIYRDECRGRSQAEKAKGFLDQYGWQKQSLDFINFYLGL